MSKPPPLRGPPMTFWKYLPSLPAGGGWIEVWFAPGTTGREKGDLMIFDNAGSEPQRVALRGRGK
jgi:hypothetical protein